jgi:RNA polymerase sigma-70 factor (ECF subfamily)
MNKPVGHTTQIQSYLDLMQAGDGSARDEIIEYSCERLRNLTRRMLRNYPSVRRWEQTDDVLQNALLRLHRSLAEVQPESVRAFLGLAATQIRRTLLDLARHHFGPLGHGKHHHTDGQGAAADDIGQPAQTHTFGEPQSMEDWTAFHEAVERLPDDEREVFSLMWYEDASQVEIASILGVTERTVRRRWQSARCLLYDLMQGDMPG